MSEALLADARGRLRAGQAVWLKLDINKPPVKVTRISAPDGNGFVNATAEGGPPIMFLPESLIGIFRSVCMEPFTSDDQEGEWPQQG